MVAQRLLTVGRECAIISLSLSLSVCVYVLQKDEDNDNPPPAWIAHIDVPTHTCRLYRKENSNRSYHPLTYRLRFWNDRGTVRATAGSTMGLRSRTVYEMAEFGSACSRVSSSMGSIVMGISKGTISYVGICPAAASCYPVLAM